MPIRPPTALLLLALLAGCAESVPPAPIGPLVLTIEYRGSSDERPLEEIKLHSAQQNYASAPNLLTQNLRRNEAITFRDIEAGEYFLTVIRLLLPPPVQQKIALTTAESFSLSAGHVVIWVFDESFRIFDAKPTIEAGGPDLTLDAGADAMPDAMPDAAPDAAPDSARDVGGDAEASVEGGSDAPAADAPDSMSPDGPMPDGPSLDTTRDLQPTG